MSDLRFGLNSTTNVEKGDFEKKRELGRLKGLRTLSDLPCEMATNLSVVGSGPILCPGKSWPTRFRMKVVLPTEYLRG